MSHREIHKQQHKSHRPDKPFYKLRSFGILKVVLQLGLRPRGIVFAFFQRRSVPCVLNSLNYILRSCRALYAHRISQKTYGTACYSGYPAYRLFDPRLTRRATHTRNLILFHSTTSLSVKYHFISFCRVTRRSSTVSVFPAFMSSVTQVFMCVARSSLLNAFSAAFAAAT